jgi:pyruvate dehydrogenase (quinone)
MPRTVADQLADVLVAAGVRRIFGTAGDNMIWLAHAIQRQGKLQWVPMQHAEVAAFAATTEARLTSELAVCAGSCGPGNLRLTDVLFDCHRSHVPVLAIVAPPPVDIGSIHFPEPNLQDLFGDCSHYSKLVSAPNQMRHVLETAIREAVGEHGVSVVVLPGEIACQPAPDASPREVTNLLPPIPVVTLAQTHRKQSAAMPRVTSC